MRFESYVNQVEIKYKFIGCLKNAISENANSLRRPAECRFINVPKVFSTLLDFKR